MKGIVGKIESGNLLVRNLDACWVDIAILESSHPQAVFGRCLRDELKNDLKGGEGSGSPIDGNERKESMLDLVPFTSRRWIMSHGDREARLVGQLLQLLLPPSTSARAFLAIGARMLIPTEVRVNPFQRQNTCAT